MTPNGDFAVFRTGPRYPWVLVALLWAASFLNSADRSVVVAVMPQVRAEFALTATQLALVSSVFFWIYAVASFFSGRLGDRVSRSRVIMGGLAFWSVATGVGSLSTGFVMLLAVRGVVALGESTYYPAATALISDWHSPLMRSRALSLNQTGVFAGAGIGAYSAGVLADRFGWRIPFVVFGVAGLALCVVLRKGLHDAPKYVPRARVGVNQSPLALVLACPPALMLCAVFFLATGAATGLSVWAPTYVHDVLGLNLGDSALYGSASINVAGFLAVPLGGLLADWLARRSALGRFYALATGLTLAGMCLLPLTWARSALSVGAVLLASSVGKGLFDGCVYASLHDVVPPEARSTAVGLMTMVGFFGAGLMPVLVALASGRLGMAAGLTSLTVLYFIAVATLLATRQVTRRFVLETRQKEEGSQ